MSDELKLFMVAAMCNGDKADARIMLDRISVSIGDWEILRAVIYVG